jgi:hypothetical protein
MPAIFRHHSQIVRKGFLPHGTCVGFTIGANAETLVYFPDFSAP